MAEVRILRQDILEANHQSPDVRLTWVANIRSHAVEVPLDDWRLGQLFPAKGIDLTIWIFEYLRYNATPGKDFTSRPRSRNAAVCPTWTSSLRGPRTQTGPRPDVSCTSPRPPSAHRHSSDSAPCCTTSSGLLTVCSRGIDGAIRLSSSTRRSTARGSQR